MKATKNDGCIGLSADRLDRRISFVLVFQLCMLITDYTVKLIFNITDPSVRVVISLVSMTMVGILFIYNLRIVLLRIGLTFLGAYSIFGIVFAFNALVFEKNIPYIVDISFNFFLICLPVALYYIAIKDKGIFLTSIVKSAYYQIYLGILYLIVSLLRGPRYDMGYSYLVLVPVVILTNKAFQKFSVIDTLLVLIGLAGILMIGSRGPLLAYLGFVALCIVLELSESRGRAKGIIKLFAGLIVFLSSLIYYEEILLRVDLLLNRMGVNSRSLTILLSPNIDFLTGRAHLYEITKLKIFENPLWGYGLAGDRVFLDGTYPHNILLEVIAQFGVILGFLVLLIMMGYLILAWTRVRTSAERQLLVIFFGIGAIYLLVSGSYTTSTNFWLFMAICFGAVHKRRTHDRSAGVV